MRREGMTYFEMAVEMGASMFTARHRAQEARRRGMDCPEDVRRMRSKAPNDEVLLRLLERGASPKRIAAAAGVSRTTVYYWRKRAMRRVGGKL